MSTSLLCPCDSLKNFEQCCQPYLIAVAFPETAEALMRSRYTAYTLKNKEYLLATWHPNQRPQTIAFEGAIRWLGLKIIGKKNGLLGDKVGVVHFIARYKGKNGQAVKLEEQSEFIYEAGRWFYLRALNLK